MKVYWGFRKKAMKKIYVQVVKRFLDILLSMVLLIGLSPVYGLVFVILYGFQGRPILFEQIRMGLNGKKFKIYKFRTMMENAEELKCEFSEEERKEYQENLKIKKDRRVTKIGKILRRTSLDELPQLYNILKGEMSLIGPRPILEIELARYQEKRGKFLSLKPGLIGYWQAYSKKDTTYEERMKMEIFYVENVSFWFDIKIFFKSILTVIRKALQGV